MSERVCFSDKATTTQFFNLVKQQGDFSTWKQMYQTLEMNRSDFDSMRNAARTIPETKFEELMTRLLPHQQKKYGKIAIRKPKNWGQRLAGKITYAKHKEIFENGRLLALAKNKNRVNEARVKFNVDQPLSEDLCEFLGAFAGDGFTNQYGRHYFTQFTGDRRYDAAYYKNKIIPIAKNLFNIKSCSIWEKDNTFRATFHSKVLFEFLIQRFKMPAGVKFDTVQIPDEIKNGESKHVRGFIRGTFDTDGCVYFDNRKIYKSPYLRLDLTMYNPKILDQIAEKLNQFGIKAQRLKNEKHLQITSKKDVQDYLKKIGSSNPRHINKIIKKYPEFEQYNPAKPPNQA